MKNRQEILRELQLIRAALHRAERLLHDEEQTPPQVSVKEAKLIQG